MSDSNYDFAKAHASGANQEEIINLMMKIEPCLDGHSRAIITITMIRIIAAMLAPARPETKKALLHELPIVLRSILTKMEELHRERR